MPGPVFGVVDRVTGTDRILAFIGTLGQEQFTSHLELHIALDIAAGSYS
jgi:hypothetical protein